MLEIKHENKSLYAITMRKTKFPDKVKEVDYINRINYFTSTLGVDFKKIVFEKTSGLHMHGIILIPRNLSLTRFRVRGWSIKLEEIYDVEGWLRYYTRIYLKTKTMKILLKHLQRSILRYLKLNYLFNI